MLFAVVTATNKYDRKIGQGEVLKLAEEVPLLRV